MHSQGGDSAAGPPTSSGTSPERADPHLSSARHDYYEAFPYFAIFIDYFSEDDLSRNIPIFLGLLFHILEEVHVSMLFSIKLFVRG